jgi:hypothetical protein
VTYIPDWTFVPLTFVHDLMIFAKPYYTAMVGIALGLILLHTMIRFFQKTSRT